MKFTLKQLSVFDRIAQCQNVSQAAKQLSMTQSAASMALAQLESQLGHSLFERHGKRLELNAWGHWLRSKAHALLNDAVQIEMGFVGQHAVSGALSFGASQTLAEYLVPDLIACLDNEFSQLTINLNVDNSRHIIKGVLDYQYDLGVIEGRCDNERLSQQPWCTDELLIVVSKHHPLAQKTRIDLSSLSDEIWVLREKGAGTRDIFDHAIHPTLESLNVWREYNHVPTLIALVKSGKYISCLPQSSVADALNSGDLVALNCIKDRQPLIMKRTFTFIWRKASNGQPLIKTILSAADNIRQTHLNTQAQIEANSPFNKVAIIDGTHGLR